MGYDDVFGRLQRRYLRGQLARGGSAEKFVVGPYGSGKTHFLRQFLELAREDGFVTSEVALNRDVDFTDRLMVFREVVLGLQIPGWDRGGMEGLVLATRSRIRERLDDPVQQAHLVEAWLGDLGEASLNLPEYGRVFARAIEALEAGDQATFSLACRWLGGGADDRMLARALSLPAVQARERALHGRRAMLALFQIVRKAGFSGTVVGLDEAEQGLNLSQKRTQQVLSMLQSDINALSDVPDASGMMIYALTPDLLLKMEQFPALQQRVSDPFPGRGFMQGEDLAPVIDLRERTASVADLEAMGHRLAELLYAEFGDRLAIPLSVTLPAISMVAARVGAEDAGAGNRRTMARRTASLLLKLHDNGELQDTGNPGPPPPSDTEF